MSLLEIKNVTKNFGGLVAISNLSLTIESGEIVGLVGPNGSGKTTLFNLIAGFLKVNKGKIIFKGKDITNNQSHKIVAQGIGRTWQIANPFPNYTLYENVKVSCLVNDDVHENMNERVMECLSLVGLGELINEKARNLPIGNLQRLEIARALATSPYLLLLDEPFGGLTHSEIQGLKRLISELQSKGVTIFIVEHVIREIIGLVERLIVLNFGMKLAEGPPEEVINDKKVVEAYLGRGYYAEDR